MARYVLLRIEDNDAAESFVKSIRQQDVFFSQSNEDGTGSYGYLKATVLGLFGAPTLFCECDDKSDVSARSKKFGWWVHRKCGKPKKGNMQHPYNLLEPDRPKAIQERRDLYIGVTEPRPKED
jgi:hypothetical protein